MSRVSGTSIIFFFCVFASILSVTADMEGMELGALFNLVIPPMVGAISLIILFLVWWLTKSKIYRILTVVVCSLYLLYVGYIFHYFPGYMPFPF